jgi:uncharacterized protein YvpB
MQPDLRGSIFASPPSYPVEGTPLIPPTYLTGYFLCFLFVLSAVYFYYYRRKQPVLLWHKIRLLVIITVLLKATIIGGGALIAAYWLVPPPRGGIVTPTTQNASFSPTNKVEIFFDRPISRSLLEKSISPDVPGRWIFENSFYSTHFYRKLVFYPTYSLRPNTVYTVKLSHIQNLTKVFKPYDHQFTFTTQPSPQIESVSPSKGKEDVDPNTDITVKLNAPNESISEFYFQTNPSIELEQSLDNTHTVYTLRPKTPFKPGTTYTLNIQKSDVIFNLEEGSPVERAPTTDEYEGTFTTKQTSNTSSFQSLLNIASVQVSGISPRDGWTAVNTHSPIKVTFDSEVDHTSAEQKFSLSPQTKGAFSWNGTTMIFTPEKPLEPTSSYTVTIASGVKAIRGRSLQNVFKSTFTTQNATTKLAVPIYLQKYTLSCEIASLRMALNFRGLTTTEDELIPKVGKDPTPHKGNIWGDPNNAFVGNIAGTQMSDGYGVHWAPIAKAARNYRDAQDFEGWNIEQLTTAIENNNPVVIWVYSHHGTKTSWKTPEGKDIFAVRDEHAVTAVGFVGPAANPTEIIVNDPLIGQVHWSRATFDKKWDIFGRSGVVIY